MSAPNRIRLVLRDRDLSAEKLAEMLNTSAATVTRMETGAQGVTLDWLAKIAAALECRQADLIIEANERPALCMCCYCRSRRGDLGE